jgi:hypothetical protein
MVTTTEAVPLSTAHERGFFPEETLVGFGTGSPAVTTYYRPFWRPVVAGTILALSLFTLSWYLMLGCHVGITAAGVISLGAGAAVWLWVTSCIAYFFGGMIASAMTMPAANGWLKGPVIWALSVPMALLLDALLMQGANLVGNLYLPHAAMAQEAAMAPGDVFGFVWTVFIGLALGLIFSIVGSASGCAARK